MIAHACLWLWLLVTWAGSGASAWLAIHQLTGGGWGDALGPGLRRLRALLPVAAVAAVPLLIAAAHVFPWLQGPVDPARRWYFTHAFLVWRTAGCFFAWGIGAGLSRRAPAATLILWLFACGIFANDWIVSLVPEWRSSAIGLIAALGQLVVAFTIAMLSTLVRETPVAAGILRDQGNLLLALCLGWAYLVGIDYLTAWMADLPYETVWYLPRTHGLWAAVAVAAVTFHLLVPFALLLVRAARNGTMALRMAVVSALLGQACHVAWMVMP
jgi:hypothetical protein